MIAMAKSNWERWNVFLAAAALLLTLGHIFVDYVPAPKIWVSPPEQALIYKMNYPSYGEEIVRFGAGMTYVNERRFGGQAVLIEELLVVNTGKKSIFQKAQWRGDFDWKDGELVQLGKRGIHGLVIGPGQALGHETNYAPRSVPGGKREQRLKNFVTWDEFWASLKYSRRVDFCFIGRFKGSKDQIARCSISFSADDINRNLSRKALAPACIEVTNTSPCEGWLQEFEG